MKSKGFAQSVLILSVIGVFVSGQQVSAESVFSLSGAPRLEKLRLQPLLLSEADPTGAGMAPAGFFASRGDTIETFEVQVEEDKGPGVVKQLVIFGIVTAVVGYAVIMLLGSDDETTKTKPQGKNPPVSSAAAGFFVPLTR